MNRTVNLNFGDFTLYALTGGTGSADDEVRASAIRALRFYLRDGESGRASWPCPAFLPDVEGHAGLGLEVDVEEDLWSSLEQEADRQGVSANQLAEHAALYFAANWDDGRAAQMLVEGLDA